MGIYLKKITIEINNDSAKMANKTNDKHMLIDTAKTNSTLMQLQTDFASSQSLQILNSDDKLNDENFTLKGLSAFLFCSTKNSTN